MQDDTRLVIELPCGLPCIIVRREVSSLLFVAVAVRVGKHDSPSKLPHLAHFVEHLVFTGDNESIVDQLGENRADVNGFTSGDYTQFEVSGHCDDLSLAAKFAANVFRPFNLSDADYQREHSILCCELADEGDSHNRQTRQAQFFKQLGGDPNWKQTTADEKKTLHRLKRQVVERFHQTHYCPKNAALIVVSPLSPAQVEEQLRSAFEGQTGSAGVPRRVVEPYPSRKIVWSFDVHSPVWVNLYYSSPDTSPLMRSVAWLIATAIGRGHNSMMFKRFRRDSGTAYNATADSYSWLNQTAVSCFFSVHRSQASGAIRYLCDQMQQFVDEGMNDKWFERELFQWRRRLDMEMEDARSFAYSLAYEALRDGSARLLWGIEYFELFENSSITQLRDAARTLLHESRLRVFVGGNVGLLGRWRIGRTLKTSYQHRS